MKYAQITQGTVQNVIVLNDASLESLFLSGYDSLIRVDQLSPEPGIGWTYQNGQFIAPETLVEP